MTSYKVAAAAALVLAPALAIAQVPTSSLPAPQGLLAQLEGVWKFSYCPVEGGCAAGGQGLRRYRKTINAFAVDYEECFVKLPTLTFGSIGYLPGPGIYYEFSASEGRGSPALMTGPSSAASRIIFTNYGTGGFKSEMSLDLAAGRHGYVGYDVKDGEWRKQFDAEFTRASAGDKALCQLPSRSAP